MATGAVRCGRHQQQGHVSESQRVEIACNVCLLRMFFRRNLLPGISAKLLDPEALVISTLLHPSSLQLPFRGQVLGRIMLITGLSYGPACLASSTSVASPLSFPVWMAYRGLSLSASCHRGPRGVVPRKEQSRVNTSPLPSSQAAHELACLLRQQKYTVVFETPDSPSSAMGLGCCHQKAWPWLSRGTRNTRQADVCRVL